mmetsp:Transcript_185/g.281  ORF Transcript_185/g.281 Transcript_185/m.281 type:complete len:417 (+) Transcript_185:185-1435(+)|eukprot:CAMPEP_0184869128 /NCGR_PEP_ID=MMETSP0580-20130426/33033_1 /TAXON_ID=1118495 /ORGANISM="Dactyliosolen fragilissimus" /LENGTH=416 /DNA_ID=CAMNT_0027370419 /DNA_START=163 /DNA_END=1413 /DNA_ORIENTATION=+
MLTEVTVEVLENILSNESEDLDYNVLATAKDGCLYFIPDNSRRISKFDPVTKSVKEIGNDLGCKPGSWHGGVMNTYDGCTYFVPSSARHILKYDPLMEVASFVGENLGDEEYKWAGGVQAKDGCIYCTPDCADKILKYDPIADKSTFVGNGIGLKPFRFSGEVLGYDGNIYYVPSCAKQVLKYNPSDDTANFIGDEYTGIGKWYGGVLAPDGFIYCNPSSSKRYLRIDIMNQSTSLVGPTLDLTDEGVLGRDGCIYISSHDCIIKFDPRTNQDTKIPMTENVKRGKYYGGAVAHDGCIYAMDYSNPRRLLKLTVPPPKQVLITPHFRTSLLTKISFEHSRDFGSDPFNCILKYFEKLDGGFVNEFDNYGKKFLPYILQYANEKDENSKVNVLFEILRNDPSLVTIMSTSLMKKALR